MLGERAEVAYRSVLNEMILRSLCFEAAFALSLQKETLLYLLHCLDDLLAKRGSRSEHA